MSDGQGGLGRSVEAWIEELFAAGRAAWPEILLSREAFAQRVSRHLPGDDELPSSALHAADLYLACACADRVRGALEAFDARYGHETVAALRGRNASLAEPEELRQVLWEKLFVGRPGAPPKIADYAGRGPLGGWVRVAAVRAAMNLHERGAREARARVDDAEPPELAGLDPEVAFLKERYRGDLKRALEDTIAALPHEQRNVLRLYFLDGSSIDRIALAYGVHRATAARWVTRDRDALLAGARRLLAERLRIDGAELDSLIGLVQSQIDLSLGGLLSPTQKS